ncbi:MAG TPA: hypothetical protein VFT34_01365 [Verrucomicrobiae bacterium]|nr:hypothetical protein [Verrucomicrobiae bacterium]
MTCKQLNFGMTRRDFFGRFAVELGGVALAQPASALQVRNVTAQGEALGIDTETSTALKGRHKARPRLCRPFRAEVPWTHDTQGVALGYHMTAFQAENSRAAEATAEATMLTGHCERATMRS